MIITRDILEVFKKWKTSADRKPILIKGARQIGKTWHGALPLETGV